MEEQGESKERVRRAPFETALHHAERLFPSENIECYVVNQSVVSTTHTQEEEECVERLRCSSDDYALCAEKWEKKPISYASNECTPMKKSHTYLQEFPCLKRSFGYELLIADFDAWYPENKHALENKLPLLKSKLLWASESTSKRSPFVEELKQLAQGYGLFQWLLLMCCGAVYAVCAVSTTTLSFVLPAAECDFGLSSSDKGRLTATPLIGMCVGSYFWGNLADARGRKKAIIGALLLDAFAAFLSSVVQSFPAFLACRFFSGFGIIGATGLIFPYFGDFLSLRHRDVMLCRLEVFWTLGCILLPGIAWLIIQDPRFRWFDSDTFKYTEWRVFVAACGLPSLFVVILLLPFPESPRFLLYVNMPERALQVLQRIFVVNTRMDPKDFPVESMISATEGDEEEVVAADNNGNETKAALTWKQRWQNFWIRKKMLTTQPFVGLLALCCFVDFGLMFSYYTLMMWFPDLFERYSQFTAANNGMSAGVCEVTANVSHAERGLTECKQTSLDNEVYTRTLVVALSCVPVALCVGIFINFVGKKIMLVMMLMSSGLSVLGLTLVRSSLENMVLSCVFESIVSCTEAVLFCVICEIFPTKVAATAMAVAVMCGRVGAIVGNVVFGALVDQHCEVPIYIFGTLLISSGLLCILIPKSTRPERPQ